MPHIQNQDENIEGARIPGPFEQLAIDVDEFLTWVENNAIRARLHNMKVRGIICRNPSTEQGGM